MKSFLFIPIFCLLHLNMFAISNREDLNKYYYYTHKAEHFLVNGFYDKADCFYDSSMAYKDYPFATDIDNALMCCLITKKFEKALYYSLMLVRKGATLNYFNKKCFEEFNNSVFKQGLLKEYPMARKAFVENFDNQLFKEISRLVNLDQQVHCLLQDNASDKTFVSEMHNSDSRNFDTLEVLMERHDYLSEEVIGANFSNDTTISITPLYSPIVIHQIQRSGESLTRNVNDAVRRGKLNSIVAATWLGLALMPELNLCRKFKIYNDTLWKTKESAIEERMYKSITRQTALTTDSVLEYYFLNDVYFEVEERVLYNFFKERNQVKFRWISVLPSAFSIKSLSPGSENQFETNIRIDCYPFAYKHSIIR